MVLRQHQACAADQRVESFDGPARRRGRGRLGAFISNLLRDSMLGQLVACLNSIERQENGNATA